MLKFNRKIKNKIDIVSIHIPKTAGTSFRNILKENYGEDAVKRFDIVKKEKHILVEKERLVSKKLPSHIKVIHGHFNYADLVEKLDIKQGTSIITWLRDPVERVVSNYFYLAKRLKEELQEEKKGLNILAKMQKSLIEYARLEMNQNRMSKFLNGISIEEMKFVGIQEHFDEDLEYFGYLFDFGNIKPLEQNVTGKKKELSPEIREEIAKLNAIDMAIYRKAIELRNKRLIHNI